jgi:hypothetical protein
VTNVPNDGHHTVLLPSLTTSSARVMVRSVGNVFFNVSPGNFSIAPHQDTFVITTAAAGGKELTTRCQVDHVVQAAKGEAGGLIERLAKTSEGRPTLLVVEPEELSQVLSRLNVPEAARPKGGEEGPVVVTVTAGGTLARALPKRSKARPDGAKPLPDSRKAGYPPSDETEKILRKLDGLEKEIAELRRLLEKRER